MAGPQEVLAGAGWGNLSLDQEPSARPSTSSRPASVASGRAAPVTPASQKPDCSRWNCIYPAYIDKKKSSKQGRRVIASLAAENPQAYEIADCCAHFKLPTVLENKHYSRDFLQPGRVRVQIKREDGSIINPAIPNRKKLLEEVAKLVPKHTGRQKKAAEPATGGGSGSGGKSGKSGKKKK